jgi:putative sporulation protein YtaF
MSLISWLTVIGFALSSSIDNFGVGITYGVSNIRIGNWANFIIAVIAFAFSVIGIEFGKYASKLFPGMMTNIIAALFLFIISIRIMMMAVWAKRKSESVKKTTTTRPSFTGSHLENPELADKDQSGEISTVEALVLGVAVSMNALTNGLGAGLLKLSPLAISISAAVFSFLAIWSGVKLGTRVADVRIGKWTLGQFSTAISGFILLLIGVHVLLSH